MNNIHSPPGDLKIGPITSNTITDYSFRVFSLFLGRWAVARLARGFAVRNEAAPGTGISPFHRDPADAVTGPVPLPGEIRGSLQIQSARFRPWRRSLLPHCFNSGRDSRNNRPSSPLSLFSFPFPSLLQLRPHFVLPGHSVPFSTKNEGRGH